MSRADGDRIEKRGEDVCGSKQVRFHSPVARALPAKRGFLAGTPDGAPIAALRQSRRRPAAGWESLTDAEMDVVRLVAAGMTNRQIAARLYLSPRTVQTHVSHIMRKLGVARRSEIAAETSRRQR